MHIAVEGIDGSGKSTLAKLLAGRFNLNYIEKPMQYLLGERGIETYQEVVSSLNAEQGALVKSLFYACGNAFTVKNFKNIVTDRHILSNYFHNSDEENRELFQILIKTLGKPDFTFLLFTDNRIRGQRMIERNPLDPDVKNINNFRSEEFSKMEEFLKNNGFRYAVIDNTTLKPEEVLEKAVIILRDKKILF